MSDYRHCWEPTAYPRKCPECGARTVIRRPPLLRGLGWAAYALSMVALFLVYRSCGGLSFGRRGSVLCPECGWVRSGEEEGTAVRRRRRQGASIFIGMAMGLIPAILFFLFAWFFGRTGAENYVVPLSWLSIATAIAHGTFVLPRPARRREARS